MAKTLVIVESPAKAQTLERFLGDGYRRAGELRPRPRSAGVGRRDSRRDPKKKWGRLGVDTDGDFKPYYVVPNDKRKHVAGAEGGAEGRVAKSMLATDPDREGESISWHLHEVLKPKVPVKRIVFHEITEEGDQARRSNDAHDVDENLVRAQESRRILDRLYGYTLSPVLWKKVQTGLSAGRVQSVAVRLIVDREEERLAFRAAALLGSRSAAVAATAASSPPRSRASATQRVATGKDFDANGVLTGKNARAAVRGRRRGARRRARSATCRGRSPRSRRSRASSGPRRRSRPRRSRRKRAASSGSRPSGRCRRRSGCSRTATSPITAPTRRRSARRRSANRRAAIREMFGDDYYAGPRRYATQGQERAGSARSDPADRLRQRRRRARRRARPATICASTS